MRLDDDQLEWIVREVVRRLRNDSPYPPTLPPGEAPVARAAANTATPDARLTLTQTLITAATLQHQLDGVTQITVPPKAIITPAARDLLKQLNIQLTSG
jgi:hypothetical protein